MKAFWRALSVFAGTIIGVGIFGLPWVSQKSGFLLLFLYFFILSIVAILVHLMFGEVCLLTETKHRFPGYVKEYLGRKWGRLALIVNSLGLLGAQLAYLIVGGGFLAALLIPFFGGGVLIYTLLFFGLGALLIYRGIRSVSLIEFIILLSLFFVLAFFLVKALPHISLDSLTLLNPKFLFLPYGVILFSLWGGAIVPEIKEIVKGERKVLRRVIVSGIIIAVLTYLFFTLLVTGTCGNEVSEDALSGFTSKLGGGIIGIGYIFGIITCFSSFLALGLTLKKTFWYDIGLSERKSWIFSSFLPLILYLMGFKSFINIIGLSGAVAIGIEGFIAVFLYKNVLKNKLKKKMNPVYYFLPLFLLVGVVAEIVYFLLR